VTPFAWDEAMRFGLGVLRLAPEAFWRMTPRELARAIEAFAGPSRGEGMSRAGLDALMARFPDQMK